MSTFQKIRFVLTIQQLFKVLGEAGAINGLVLDLSVKEDFVTVIDVNGYKYLVDDEVIISTASGESAIPTPPGAHGQDIDDNVETINLKLPDNASLKQFFQTRVPYVEPKSFENLL